ncbi:UNVERIFIED_CONTAM: hypothetical protein Sradi_2456200 [Sesamum radiatum]|uniref:Uncharacterized protein n=1 Tax=Sesamum radiatum TaxID=300843 RepID=A0AAW2SIN2_SESRA
MKTSSSWVDCGCVPLTCGRSLVGGHGKFDLSGSERRMSLGEKWAPAIGVGADHFLQWRRWQHLLSRPVGCWFGGIESDGIHRREDGPFHQIEISPAPPWGSGGTEMKKG